jgi:hypothetical protein
MSISPEWFRAVFAIDFYNRGHATRVETLAQLAAAAQETAA